MRVGSLFAGIGGFDLGLERAGFEIAWQVEIDPYCQRVLAKHWPDVQRYGDIRAVDWGSVEPVDLVCGGFPCQDVSWAGKRAGIYAERSGLWFEFERAIRDLRPRYALVENTAGLLDRGMDAVLGSLAEMGFDAEWTVLSACAFGAPHTRERVFILAYPSGERSGQLRWFQCEDGSLEEWNVHWPSNEPECERMADGIPDRAHRLIAIGNAIVPHIAEWLGQQIMKAHDPTKGARHE